jgi:hypothetical protein
MKTKLVIVRFGKYYICEYKNWKTLFDICIKCSDYYFWKDYFENNDNDLIKESFTINIAKKYEYTVMLESDWIKLRNKNHLEAHNLKVEAFDFFLDFNDPETNELEYQINRYKEEKDKGFYKATNYNFQQWLVNEYLDIVNDPC